MPFRGVTRTQSHHGCIAKSGISQEGFDRTRHLISEMSSSVHSPTQEHCRILSQMGSVICICCFNLTTISNCWKSECPSCDNGSGDMLLYNLFLLFATGGNWCKLARRRTLMLPNGTEGGTEWCAAHILPVTSERWARSGVVNILISLMLNHSVWVMLWSLLAAIALEGCVSHLLEWGVLTGKAAQVCRVCPFTIPAATPYNVILANNVAVLLEAKVCAIAFSMADFSVPPWPWTIIRHCEGFRSAKCTWR